MDNNEKFLIQRKTRLRYQWLRFKTGFCGLFTNWIKALIAVTYILFVVLFWQFKESIIYINNEDIFGAANKITVELAFPIIFIALFAALIIFLGTPFGAKEINERLLRTGLVNHAGETPLLIQKSYDKSNCVTTMEFESNGIPLCDWENNKENIETILNVYIDEIKQGKRRNRIILNTVSGDIQIPWAVDWKDEYLRNKDFEIILGRGLLKDISVDLNKIPHILIGGSTGSGKSFLLKHLLLQCFKKGAEVHIADFKGGVDFYRKWREKCTFIMDKTKLLEDLENLINELERRKKILTETSCSNIKVYNGLFLYAGLKRIIFACDEVAELLDKTGLSKEDKELISQIENKISIIARQGRAFGIHLILATQRPDANILPGQIRNNIDYRVCGRADTVLSQIILDNTKAADEIPKHTQGRFITHDGQIFQGYMYDEASL
ncbi:MAG: DUF87 domain-containing protein [Clostridia bacterium]|nr:DUF87 domain-containing protein [Clostridia bacterium]